MTTFAEKLRAIRKIRGLTLKELGEKCNPPVDYTYLSKIENGKVPIGKNLLGRLSKPLDISVDQMDEWINKEKTAQYSEAFIKILDKGFDYHGNDINEIKDNLANKILSLDMYEVMYFSEMVSRYLDMRILQKEQED